MQGTRCKNHPRFNPASEEQFDSHLEYRDCFVCCGLYYGSKPVGSFGGEFTADKGDNESARVKIGPMNLEQFGHIRFSLAFDYRQDDGPSWNTDRKSRTIYLKMELDKSRLKKIAKEFGCRVSVRVWKEL